MRNERSEAIDDFVLGGLLCVGYGGVAFGVEYGGGDIAENETGGGFVEFDHDVARMEIGVDEVVKEKHFLRAKC